MTARNPPSARIRLSSARASGAASSRTACAENLRPTANGASGQTAALIPAISAEIGSFTEAAGNEVEIEGREKRPYSIWRKMEEKQRGFSQLSDIYAFRILCRTEEDCYRALGAVVVRDTRDSGVLVLGERVIVLGHTRQRGHGGGRQYACH